MVAELLHKGAENATPTNILIHATGAKSARMLQQLIAKERNDGVVILSTTKGGYFLPDDGDKGRAEIAEFINTLHARAVNTLRVLKTAKQALEHDVNQLEFLDADDE